MTNELTIINPNAIMPVMDIMTAVSRRDAIVTFVSKLMIKDTHYGAVPGTDKPTLLKPGAEMLTTFFGLSPRFITEEATQDWSGENHGGEPFFHYRYRCQLWRGDLLAGEGLGSCNSWESKYRFRNSELVCPNCEQATIKKSKFPPRGAPQGTQPGWYCYAKIGGCGAEFTHNDPAIVEQPRGRVANPNPQDLVNTIDKMAQKRALVAATLIAINASEFFTQDLEDMVTGEYVDITPDPMPRATTNGKANKPTPPPLPDDEVVIKETPSRDFFNATAALLSSYDGVGAVKAQAKEMGYDSIPGKVADRLEMYRALKAAAPLPTTAEQLPFDEPPENEAGGMGAYQD